MKSPDSLRMVSSAPPHLFETGSPHASAAGSVQEKSAVTSPTMTVHVTEARLDPDSGKYYLLISLKFQHFFFQLSRNLQ